MYCVNGKHFADLYRNKISGYADWCEQELGCGFYFNADNIGPYMSLDETCLSNGEVWTFLTNKDGHGAREHLQQPFPEQRVTKLYYCCPIKLFEAKQN